MSPISSIINLCLHVNVLYSEICNITVAFHCSDLSCKPKSQECDNHVDCSDSSDEIGCQRKSMWSCSEFWNAGYRENGTYALGNQF